MKFYDKKRNIHGNRMTMVAADITSTVTDKKTELMDRFQRRFTNVSNDRDTTYDSVDDDSWNDEDVFDDSFENDDITDDEDDREDGVVIETDMINDRLNLKTISGQPIASAEISGNLTKNSTEKILGDILYPNGHPNVNLTSTIYRCKCGSMNSETPLAEMCPFCGEDCNIPVTPDDAKSESLG